MSYFSISHTALLITVCAFLLLLLALFCLRIFTKIKAKQPLAQELAQRDNFALGISYAGYIFTLTLLVGYLINHTNLLLIQDKPWHSALLFTLMLGFIKLGQAIHRKWILSRFNEEKAILKQNVCAAIVDSGMLLANCIVIMGLFNWASTTGLYSILVIALCFLLLQSIFALDSKIREWLFAKGNQGASLQSNFNLENTSIGIRYAGKTVGLALALYAGLHSAAYHHDKMVENLFTLALHCGLMWLLVNLFAQIITRFALYKVNTSVEVDHQDNIGIAAVEFTAYIATGYLLIQLFTA